MIMMLCSGNKIYNDVDVLHNYGNKISITQLIYFKSDMLRL